MITGILTVVGGLLGLIVWFLNRKSPLRRNFEEIEYERRKRLRDIDSWWTRRP